MIKPYRSGVFEVRKGKNSDLFIISRRTPFGKRSHSFFSISSDARMIKKIFPENVKVVN